MFVLLGSLGLAQALFLPGAIAARLLGVRGRWAWAAASVGLSLLVNLGLVSALVALGLYRREVLLPIVAAELALAAWVATRAKDAAAATEPVGGGARMSAAELIALIAVLALAGWYVGRVGRAASGIFTGWDDVASWNRWAMDWYRGLWPRHTWHYPQALPVAWSLPYAFMATDRIQSFARGMMPLFGLATMAAGVSLAQGGDRLRAFAAAWFAGTFLARANNVTAGLADLPVACFAMLAFAECLRRDDGAPSVRRASLFAAGAALTKQAGVFVALVVPALAAGGRPRGRRLRAALAGYALVAVIALPWYALKQWEIATGRETSEVAHVLTGAHRGLTPLERPAFAIARLSEIAGGPLMLALVIALGLLGLRDRAVRPILLAVAVPFTLIWAFGFSYDPRNLSIALVAWGVGCGAGVATLLARRRGPEFALPRFLARPPARALAATLAAGAVAVLALAVAHAPDARFLARQSKLQRGLGDPLVAGTLADLRAGGRLRGRVVTDERVLLAYAPGWDSTFVIAALADTARLAVAVERPDVEWLLIPADAPPAARSMLEGLRSEGRWAVERELGERTLWRRGPAGAP